MNSKRFFAILTLVLVLSASCAYSKVTEQQALSDQRIAPFVEATKQQGAKLLPGRYAHVKEILSRSGKNGEKINAPTDIVIEISDFSSEHEAYPSNFDVYGEGLAASFITLDTSGAVPVMKTYVADDNGEYKLIAEDFAVVISEGNNSYAWLLGSVETGEIRYLFPLNDFWFPDKWYEGSWLGKDGSEIELKNGTVTSDGEVLGTFIISDNRVAIKMQDGTRDVIYCAYNPTNETLVMTFQNGPNGMGENAEIYTKDDDDEEEEPETKAPPIFNPQPKQQKFPKFPMPQPKTQINLEGVWQAMLNNQQIVVQFQGNEYYFWINGQPYEMGTFEINGNVISGFTNTGTPFRNTIKLENFGKALTMTDQNNTSITYIKVQQ